MKLAVQNIIYMTEFLSKTIPWVQKTASMNNYTPRLTLKSYQQKSANISIFSLLKNTFFLYFICFFFRFLFFIFFHLIQLFLLYNWRFNRQNKYFRMSRVSELELCNLAYGGHDAVFKLRLTGMNNSAGTPFF